MFLRPSALTNAIFLFVLAVAARRFGVEVHAACVLSNHFHLVVSDPRGALPSFMQYLCGLVARAVNASLGRWEGFWSSEASYSAVRLVAPDDIVAKVAYALANPVSAGLVSRGDEWPGVRTALDQLGAGSVTIARPKGFFRENGELPKSAELTYSTPPGFASPEEFRIRASEATLALEAQRRREVQEAGRRFLGRARVLAQHPSSRPAPGEPRRELSPRIASRDKWRRIEALTRLTGFLRAYREAWNALQAGMRDVVFPAGTYLMSIRFGMRCASPPAAA